MNKPELLIFNSPRMKAYLAHRQKQLAEFRKLLDEAEEMAAAREALPTAQDLINAATQPPR